MTPLDLMILFREYLAQVDDAEQWEQYDTSRGMEAHAFRNFCTWLTANADAYWQYFSTYEVADFSCKLYDGEYTTTLTANGLVAEARREAQNTKIQ